ncbi:Ulp1 protease-like [Oryza sativa Japonica Group]|uniref:Ulp1 protease-like n=1 Tax=Oryza sativa subsp. japonica TaxID=39947 RepID=Q5ZAG7_ORYSJ|nr:Ulp1 protease-like [Oryza sativa Japonica Group]
MGLRDGFSNNKLLDDFGRGEIQPVQVNLPTKIGTIIVIDNLVYRDHPSLKLRGVPKDVRSHDIERVRNKVHKIAKCFTQRSLTTMTPSFETYPTVPLRRLDKASEEPEGTSAGDAQSR